MAKSATEGGRYRAPALDKGLDILELLAASSEGLTQAEVAKGLGRGPNEIYRMLDTLVRRGYVIRSGEGDRYILSLRLLVLADMHPPRRRLLDAAEPRMRAFTRRAEQSIHLGVIEEGDVIITSSFSAPGNWRLALRPGSTVGLFNTGSGLAMAAFQRPEARLRLYREHVLVAGEAAMPYEEFEKQTAEIRKLGYFSAPSGAVVGAVNISCPILDPQGVAIAALTCPYLRRIDGYVSPNEEETLAMVAETAEEISRQVMGPTQESAPPPR